MFLGFNITQSPMDVIREGMANGSALLIVGAILVPVLAWFTQWLNYKLMPQAPSSNNGNKTANSMENSMKTMNTVMPVFSAFMCLSSVSYTHLDVYKRQIVDRGLEKPKCVKSGKLIYTLYMA